MNELVVVDKGADWRRLKAARFRFLSGCEAGYNLGLDEFFAWYGQEPRHGFTKATGAARRVALKAVAWVPFPLTSKSRLSGSWPGGRRQGTAGA